MASHVQFMMSVVALTEHCIEVLNPTSAVIAVNYTQSCLEVWHYNCHVWTVNDLAAASNLVYVHVCCTDQL